MGINTTTGLALGAGAIDAYSSVEAGSSAKKLADRNADLAMAQSRDAIARGAQGAVAHRGQVRGLIGEQRAAQAASGVKVDTGSAGAQVAASESLGALDELTISNNAAMEAWGFRVQAADYKAKGRIAEHEGWMGAGRSLLTAGANAAAMYDNQQFRMATGPYAGRKG